MFNNIGHKIKVLAMVLCLIGIICGIVAGIVLVVEGLPEIGIPVLIGSPLLFWISSFVLYGFGQLVENSDTLVENTTKYVEITCPGCGEKLSFLKEEYDTSDSLICPLCDAVIPTVSYQEFQ